MDAEDLERELDRVRGLLEPVEESLAGYKTILRPYWDSRGFLENHIRRTHGRDSRDGIVFQPAGAEQRKPAFDSLLNLAIEWGPTLTEQRHVKSVAAGYVREIKKIKTELARLAKKRPKPDHGQGTLL